MIILLLLLSTGSDKTELIISDPYTLSAFVTEILYKTAAATTTIIIIIKIIIITKTTTTTNYKYYNLAQQKIQNQ